MKLGESLRRNSRLAAGIIVPLIFSSLGLGCRSANNGEIAPQILNVTTIGFDADTSYNLTNAANRWHARYDCGRGDVVISKGDIKSLPWEERTTVEDAVAGSITIYSYDIVPTYVVTHAMTHACKPDLPTILPEPLPFVDGYIVGYHGLNLLIKLHDGSDIMFTKFEEGMSERNADDLMPNSGTNDPSYNRLKELTLIYFPSTNSQADDLVKNNDVPGFVRTVLGLPGEFKVSSVQIEKVMSYYDKAWRGDN